VSECVSVYVCLSLSLCVTELTAGADGREALATEAGAASVEAVPVRRRLVHGGTPYRDFESIGEGHPPPPYLGKYTERQTDRETDRDR
jgi:hypothetical protein